MNNYKNIKINTIFQNNYIKLENNLVRSFEGVEFNHIKLSEPSNNIEKISGVVILPIYENKIGLIHHYRYAIDTTSIELPRGYVDIGETLEDAATRELEEETGSVTCTNVKYLGKIYPNSSIIESCAASVMININNFKNSKKEKHEIISDISFYTLKEVMKMINNGVINDGFTLSTLSLAICSGVL